MHSITRELHRCTAELARLQADGKGWAVVERKNNKKKSPAEARPARSPSPEYFFNFDANGVKMNSILLYFGWEVAESLWESNSFVRFFNTGTKKFLYDEDGYDNVFKVQYQQYPSDETLDDIGIIECSLKNRQYPAVTFRFPFHDPEDDFTKIWDSTLPLDWEKKVIKLIPDPNYKHDTQDLAWKGTMRVFHDGTEIASTPYDSRRIFDSVLHFIMNVKGPK
jgi:hypothetical protein